MLDDTPRGADVHAEGCARSLPYSSPLWRSLDAEHCPRCYWLVSLLDDARDRRLAERESVKKAVVSILDKLPHGARGHSFTSLLNKVHELQMHGTVAPSISYASRTILLGCIRELQADQIVGEHTFSGSKHYVLKGK